MVAAKRQQAKKNKVPAAVIIPVVNAVPTAVVMPSAILGDGLESEYILAPFLFLISSSIVSLEEYLLYLSCLLVLLLTTVLTQF
jgi:hypothetical protein